MIRGKSGADSLIGSKAAQAVGDGNKHSVARLTSHKVVYKLKIAYIEADYGVFLVGICLYQFFCIVVKGLAVVKPR